MVFHYVAKLQRKYIFFAVGICSVILTVFSLLYSTNFLENLIEKNKYFNARENMLHRIKRRENVLAEISNYRKQNSKRQRKRLPKVIGIGVKKCGTGALIHFLNHHPLIKIHERNGGEAFYFSQNPTQYFLRHYGIRYYRDTFPLINNREITMEKTPIYFDHPPHILPERIQLFIPGVKLLLIVCDPTPRAFSDYVHERFRHRFYHDKLMENFPSFNSFLDVYLPKVQKLLLQLQSVTTSKHIIQKRLTDLFGTDRAATLLTSGLYVYHIQRWKRVFNDSSLMIIDGEEFKNNPGPIIEDIQDFIKIPKLLWREDFVQHPETGFYCYRHFNETYYNALSAMSKEEILNSIKCLGHSKGRTRNGALHVKAADFLRLQNFYSPYNQAFFDEIKKKFSWR